MVRQLEIKDRYLIKRAYKQQNEFGGVEILYYILADGDVITVKSGFKGVPTYHLVGDLSSQIGRFGGFCPHGDGGIMVGKEINKGKQWEFVCIECDYRQIYSDNVIDELANEAISIIEEEDLYL